MFHIIDITFETSFHADLVQTLQHLIFLPSQTHSSEFDPQSYFTSGLETASLLSSDAQTSFLSGNLFSEVIRPTPVPAHTRKLEYYIAEHSRPPTPNFADYLIQFDGSTKYDLSNDPRFPLLTERFIANNDLLSNKRKETELKRLQTPNLELKFEVKVKFQGLNPHPIIHVAKIEHRTTPASFEVIHIDFEKDPNLPSLAYGKFVFHSPYSGLKYTTSLLPCRVYVFLYKTNILLFSYLITSTSPIIISPTNTDNYLPSDDPNITNLMVSQCDCEKQHNLRHFNLLNVKQFTGAPSNIQHAGVKARVYVRAKAKHIKAYKCLAYATKERKICFEGSLKYRQC